MSDKKALKTLSVDEMLAADDVKYDVIEAWGGLVRIGSLTAGDILDFVESNEGPAKRTAGLRLVVNSLVDDEGNRIGREHHIEAFKRKSTAETTKLVNAVLKLNGLEKKDDTAAKNV